MLRSVSSNRGSPTDDRLGLVAASVYADGKRVADIDIGDAAEWIGRPGQVLWIVLSSRAMTSFQEQLKLHPSAIEDAGKPHQHPQD